MRGGYFPGGVNANRTYYKKGNNQVVCLPEDMAYEGAEELEIMKENDVITLRPVQPSWLSLHELSKADGNFLLKRQYVLEHLLAECDPEAPISEEVRAWQNSPRIGREV